MALKIFEGRVWGKDKRIDWNRLIKDILMYGGFLLLFILVFLIATGTLEGTGYLAIATAVVIFIRFVLKMFEKYDKEQEDKFKWFWQNETVIIEFLMKIWKMILDIANSIKNAKKSNKD